MIRWEGSAARGEGLQSQVLKKPKNRENGAGEARKIFAMVPEKQLRGISDGSTEERTSCGGRGLLITRTVRGAEWT